MSKFIIFLDIDGTLLDEKYRCNHPQISSLISKLGRKGVKFALNSNRSLEDLLPLASKFKINGPLVCENGLFAYVPQEDKTIYFMGQMELNKIKSAKDLLSTWLSEFASKHDRRLLYKRVDTVKWIGKNKSYKYHPNDMIVLDNKFRKYTTSAHIRRVVGGKLVKDLESLKMIRRYLTDRFADEDLERIVSVGASESFGNLLIFSSKASKRTAVSKLIKKEYKDYKVIAIGDEVADSEMVKGVGEFWTTANADYKVSNLADKISTHKYAKGVNELLVRFSYDILSDERISSHRDSRSG